MMLTRFVLAIPVGLAATSRAIAHEGHGSAGYASGVYHYLISHGLGMALFLAVGVAALLTIPRFRRRNRDHAPNDRALA